MSKITNEGKAFDLLLSGRVLSSPIPRLQSYICINSRQSTIKNIARKIFKHVAGRNQTHFLLPFSAHFLALECRTDTVPLETFRRTRPNDGRDGGRNRQSSKRRSLYACKSPQRIPCQASSRGKSKKEVFFLPC